MPNPLTQLYIHFVWATWDRRPMITDAIREQLFACIIDECRKMQGTVIALDGMMDHLHLLVKISPASSVANLIKQVKGSSSHLITHTIPGADDFKWQGSYGAFSVSKADLKRVRDYIRGQRDHHEKGTLLEEWEQTFLPDEMPA